MSSWLSHKRRRLNDATEGLKKPFVSPLRAAKTEPATPLSEARDYSRPLTYTPSTLAHTVQPYVSVKVVSRQAVSGPAKSTPIRRLSLLSASAEKRPGPEEVALQRSITALELEIRRVQNDLDSLRQAEQITDSSTDTDLAELVDKWRWASQAVADELFETVKERVYQMGGVAAWRASEKQKYNHAHWLGDSGAAANLDMPKEDNADCEFDSQGEELPEAEQQYRKKLKRQAMRETAEAADIAERNDIHEDASEKQIQQQEENDDNTFTMDMMLRSLNIELDLIGYDRDAERWAV